MNATSTLNGNLSVTTGGIGITGNSYFQKLVIHSNIVVGIIFLLLSIEMILSLKEEKEVVITNLLSIILFSIGPSMRIISVPKKEIISETLRAFRTMVITFFDPSSVLFPRARN
mgnify:CR=1 FL=1